MATGDVPRRVRGESTAIDLESEEGRGFLQERLGFYNKLCFLISGSFFLVGAALLFAGLEPPEPVTREQQTQAVLLHAFTLLVSLLAWIACARGPRFPAAGLRAIDAGSVVLVCAGFCVQYLRADAVALSQMGPFPRLTLVLILTHALVTRSIFLPSPTSWTVVVSALAAAPVVATAGLAPLPPYAKGPAPGLATAIWAALWALCAVVVSALTSRVIYGLRQEVREARRLGQYTLEQKVGEGGMGAVYRARHAMLRRPTAIKLLPAAKAGSAALERFEREVQLTARLSHPNTVHVFDYGRTPDGVFYYAMEYLEGVNLDALVREDGPQPPARVAHVLRQVAAALVEAHGIGLIHRDVKPENVILCDRGGVPDVAKVVDFGLVRELERSSALSSTNVVTGTPLYLAPEAITSPDRVDARADLYALGAVGYYLLTGQHVFTGATLVEVCSHHLHTKPVPPSQRLGRALPAALEALVLACLEKDLARRPASALLLRNRLAELCAADPWSEDDARAWWDRFRERPDRGLALAAPGALTATVAVSLEDRA